MKFFFIILSFVGTFPLIYGQANEGFKVERLKKLKKTIRQDLKGFEVRIKRVRFRGKRCAIGSFEKADSIFQMSHGLILSTGRATDASQANDNVGKTTIHYKKKHRIVKKINQAELYDAAILQFDFYPNSEYISFNFVFASEDYPEFIHAGLHDKLFFILTLPDGKQVNLARLPSSDELVTVQTINPVQAPHYYINNCASVDPIPLLAVDTIVEKTSTHQLVMAKRYNATKASTNSANYPIQYDGFTKVLKAQYPVVPNKRHRLQIAIADHGNPIFDSAVFIEMGSLHSHKNPNFCTGILKRDPSYYYDMDTLSKIYWNPVGTKKEPKSPCWKQFPDIIFDYDSPVLDTKSKLLLRKIAGQLQQCSFFRLKINGYAAAKNDDVYNNKLSRARAEQVRTYLIKYGVPLERIEVSWYGDGAAITKKELTENRRVKLELIQQ